jgi:RHS repeat-associated protein
MRVLQTASETLSTRYFHTDHIGSISVITDENALVVERLSFDAWGKRRNPDGTDDVTGSITSQTTRGFTGEEGLSAAGLVHLNGRVYDPLLARMTSADPTVTDPLNPQGGTATPMSATIRLPSPIRTGSRGCQASSTASLISSRTIRSCAPSSRSRPPSFSTRFSGLSLSRPVSSERRRL